jgi:hypothetical protein
VVFSFRTKIRKKKENYREILLKPEGMMFKKKTAVTGEAALAANPRAPRYDCRAYVSINGFEGQAALKNISIGGFCMESKTYAALKQGEEHIMTITAGETSGLAPFQIKVEVRWIRSTENSFSAGFAVIKSLVGNRAMEKYIDYIAAHN